MNGGVKLEYRVGYRLQKLIENSPKFLAYFMKLR